MNIVVLLLFVMGLSMLVIAVSLFISIRRNFLAGQSYRIEFLGRVESVRFGKMLKKQAVDIHKLVHNEQISKIQKQINNCLTCKNTNECDRALEKTVVTDKELAFCPNQLSIAQQR